MAELSGMEILDYFGFTRDPFRAMEFDTADRQRIRRIVSMAVADNAMVCVVGMRGMGKTRAVVNAVRSLKIDPVVIDFPDQVRLLIGDIERTLVRELSDEHPFRSKDARKPQLRRILGEAARNRKVVVVIEEAHRVHGNTLRALKTLRSLDWMGQRSLFAVVLIGQSDPMRRAGVSEVALRADSVRMQGMTAKEGGAYIRQVLGDIFEDDAVAAVSTAPECRNFLDLQYLLKNLMGRAMVAGRRHVTKADMKAVDQAMAMAAKPAPKPTRKNGNMVLSRALQLREQGAETVEGEKRYA